MLSGDERVIGRMGDVREEKARATLKALFETHGYAEASAKDAVGELLEARYADKEGPPA